MEYSFPPETRAAPDDEPSAAERDALLDARDAAAARAAQADSAATSSPVESPRGPVLRDLGGSGAGDD
jgi:hypothetical protein